MENQKPASHQNGLPSTRLVPGVVGLLLVVCIGLFGLALYRADNLSGTATAMNFTATPFSLAVKDLKITPTSTDQNPSCEKLINDAILLSGTHCDHIGPNQVCYGNTTIQADLLPNTRQRFTQAGDVVDIHLVKRLTTSPLDVLKNDWGIAVFNIIANLPRSLPGEAVKMVVFGNTTIGNNGAEDIHSFYFSSELGQIVCDKVPFDGIMITMPNGTGVKFTINGTDLVLMGDASLMAVKNGNMDVSLYNGTASITSNGQTQYFGAGQKVQVQLGGTNGTSAIGSPSQPTPLSPQEFEINCTLTGTSCLASAFATIDPQNAQATLSVVINGTQTPTMQHPTITAAIPSATVTPRPIATSVQNTPKPPKKTPPGLEKKTPRP